MNTKHLFLLIAVSLLLSLQGCNHPPGVATGESLFNDGWEFCIGDTSANSTWERIMLPHTPRIEPLVVNDQWQGDCYYRKTFRVDESDAGLQLFLRFEAAMNVAEVRINGNPVLTHLGGYLPFVIDLTHRVNYGQNNLIEVKLNNEDNPVTGPKPLKMLDFNTYGGIYRNVTLVRKQPVYITDANLENIEAGGGIFFHTEEVNKAAARLFTDTHVRNQWDKAVKVRARHTLTDKEGKQVLEYESREEELINGQAITLRAQATMVSPALWSPAEPCLYTLTTVVYADGKPVDTDITRVGIRDIRITSEGCWINGEKQFLMGVNRHQEYPYIGYALSDNAQYRDAYLIKKGGFDYVRSSHYPPSPAFLDACDELGILVLDAIFGWQYFGGEAFEELALESSRQLIRRDRNHACILAWELSINESPMPDSFMKMAHRIAHQEYPYENCYSAGWINSYYDIYLEARQHRHKINPAKPLIVSEYGDWEYYAKNAGFNQDQWDDLKDEERNSRQPIDAGEKRLLQQVRNIQEAHNDNLSTHAIADGYWAMFDYNRGYAEDLEHSGVMDIFRLPKYAYYFFQSQRDQPGNDNDYALYIATEWEPGVSEGVRIFSNCDEVEVWIDGVNIGRRKPDTDYLSTNLKHPPFSFGHACLKPGKVEAIGYAKGRKVISKQRLTAGTPVRMELTLNEGGRQIEAGCNDVVFVYATLKDNAGTTVARNQQTIKFTVVSGDAEIIGDASRPTQAGIATVLVRIGRDRAPITISAQSEQLPEETLLLFQ